MTDLNVPTESDANQADDPRILREPGDRANIVPPSVDGGPIDSATADVRDVRRGNDYTAHPDSGFYGAGSNEGAGNDNLERETTPGYQADKADRGTIMPH